MLAEGFLRLLLYREERKFASASKRRQTQTRAHCADLLARIPAVSDPTDPHTDSGEAGPNQEELKSCPGPVGLSIPGSSPTLDLSPDFTVCIDDCSLLEQYPDLQVADSGRISHNPLRTTVTTYGMYTPVSDGQRNPGQGSHQEPRGDPVHSIPDQGYLVMGAGVNMSLSLPGSALEPMSNSVLNGLLEKQLEEVYMQHLTDNLARCNSHLGHSLLRGLVPPPQPCSQPQGPDSLEPSMEEGAGGGAEKKVTYLATQNLVPCSSNFSTPVLRISENENPHPQ